MIIVSFLITGLVVYIIYLFCPQWNIRLLKLKRTNKNRICCLTFDDGPSKEWTPQALDILKSFGIKATFFMCGKKVDQNHAIAQRVFHEGHEIGNHTMTHRIITFRSKKEVRHEINACNDIIREVTGHTPSLFRAPHGFKRPFLNKLLSEMALIPWTKGLWDTDMPSKKVLLSRLRKRFGKLEILLLHDGLDNRKIPQTRDSMIEALPEIIDEYKERGYKFMTIGELISKTS